MKKIMIALNGDASKQMICTLIKKTMQSGNFWIGIKNDMKIEFIWFSQFSSEFRCFLLYSIYSFNQFHFFPCFFLFVAGLHRLLCNQSDYWSGSASCISTKSKVFKVRAKKSKQLKWPIEAVLLPKKREKFKHPKQDHYVCPL